MKTSFIKKKKRANFSLISLFFVLVRAFKKKKKKRACNKSRS